MAKLRWKWVGYHIYSNLITVLVMLGFYLLWVELHPTSQGILIPYTLFGLGAASVLGLVCGISFSRPLRNRFEEVTIGARNLAYGNLNYRLDFLDDKELGDIAVAFNEMAAQLEKQVAALQKLAAKNEALVQKTKQTAVVKERQRLAGELHDAVSQQLFAISLTAATASRLQGDSSSKCGQLIADIEQSAAKAQAEMRALLLQLRPPTLDQEKLTDAIRSLSQELASKQTIACDVVMDEMSLPETIELQLYRVVQEGLSNVLRHSQATKVTIKLHLTADKQRVQLSIEDNGVGFSPTEVKKTSYGITSIKERMAEIGGHAEWITYPNQGTRLQVRVPIAREPLENQGKGDEGDQQ